MTLLYLDIETLPAPPEMRDLVLSTLKQPPDGEEDERVILARTSLLGEFGRVLCIGYWREPGMSAPELISGDEPDMLRRFWDVARGADVFVGHNILEFDLPFLVKRSIIHRVKPLPINFARYRTDFIFDTMRVWNLWSRDRISLDNLSKVLGLRSSKGALDGSRVAEFHAAGRLEEICAYCKDDVRLVRDVHRRMTFAEDARPPP